ncbi:hypothetical protein NDU88_001767 [Pleurodeles waltl]|uniref:Uncharacterized protein n=1 Tax=Pleurodeles waltl TaxID=8319 RepID=A0AAV7WPN6_PLEWA|nr:hypothetical protein NDU88_001767 [Pleurodeles waltl]
MLSSCKLKQTSASPDLKRANVPHGGTSAGSENMEHLTDYRTLRNEVVDFLALLPVLRKSVFIRSMAHLDC